MSDQHTAFSEAYAKIARQIEAPNPPKFIMGLGDLLGSKMLSEDQPIFYELGKNPITNFLTSHPAYTSEDLLTHEFKYQGVSYTLKQAFYRIKQMEYERMGRIDVHLQNISQEIYTSKFMVKTLLQLVKREHFGHYVCNLDRTVVDLYNQDIEKECVAIAKWIQQVQTNGSIFRYIAGNWERVVPTGFVPGIDELRDLPEDERFRVEPIMEQYGVPYVDTIDCLRIGPIFAVFSSFKHVLSLARDLSDAEEDKYCEVLRQVRWACNEGLSVVLFTHAHPLTEPFFANPNEENRLASRGSAMLIRDLYNNGRLERVFHAHAHSPKLSGIPFIEPSSPDYFLNVEDMTPTHRHNPEGIMITHLTKGQLASWKIPTDLDLFRSTRSIRKPLIML